jgi:hypothetical protein
MRRIGRKRFIALATLAAAAGAGFAVQGWPGIFLWPLALCGIAIDVLVVWFVLDLVITCFRYQSRVRSIQARVRPLTADQLSELISAPSHPDSAFARAELMRRGLDARPPKEQLFGMLTSGNSAQCGQAMTYMQIFYPEMCAQIAKGSSNLDSPESWQSRIAALRDAD